jgi:hypothetical protein
MAIDGTGLVLIVIAVVAFADGLGAIGTAATTTVPVSAHATHARTGSVYFPHSLRASSGCAISEEAGVGGGHGGDIDTYNDHNEGLRFIMFA